VALGLACASPAISIIFNLSRRSSATAKTEVQLDERTAATLDPPFRASEESQEVLSLRGRQIVAGRRRRCAVEVPDDFCRLVAVGIDRGQQVTRPPVMQEEQALADPPERRSTELRTGRGALADIVAGADVVQ
jgi:hypothetical protein